MEISARADALNHPQSSAVRGCQITPCAMGHAGNFTAQIRRAFSLSARFPAKFWVVWRSYAPI
jgi:hypothetical protein